jgi:hypothetical protein
MTRVELAGNDVAIATLRTAIQRFLADGRLPERIEITVAEWISREVNPYPNGPVGIGEPMGGPDAEAHAARVVRELECKCESLGDHPNLLPAAAYRVACVAATRGAEQRKAGRLDDARQTAARFSAFGRMLTRRDVNNAVFHLIMCMAFAQESKNAWKVKDYATIGIALRKALAEAYTALRIEPRNVIARVYVARLQDKLFGLASVRP